MKVARLGITRLADAMSELVSPPLRSARRNVVALRAFRGVRALCAIGFHPVALLDRLAVVVWNDQLAVAARSAVAHIEVAAIVAVLDPLRALRQAFLAKEHLRIVALFCAAARSITPPVLVLHSQADKLVLADSGHGPGISSASALSTFTEPPW